MGDKLEDGVESLVELVHIQEVDEEEEDAQKPPKEENL